MKIIISIICVLKVNKLHKYSKQKITYATMKKEVLKRAGAENSNNAISENLLPFKVREDIRMEQKNEKKSKKKSLTGI